MIHPDEYRAQSLAGWNESAAGWERRRGWLRENLRPVGDRLLALAELRPGLTVLELAAGTGDLSRAIAEAVGRNGRVLSTDFSPAMVDAARRSAAAAALTNVEYRVLDAERNDLPGASVDRVLCRFGYMLMADPAAALRETRRVLRDGGLLAFAVWAGPEHNPWAALPAMTLVRRGHVPPPEPGAPGMFTLADPERIRELVTGAGFATPELHEITFAFAYADGDDLWDALLRLSRSVARAIEPLDPDERDAIRAAIEASLAPWLQDDGRYVLPAFARAVRAR